jgi:transposase
VRSARVWKRLLGVEHTVVDHVLYDEEENLVLVARMRPTRSRRGLCLRRCPGNGRRRWRTLDLGVAQAFLEAEAPQVRCRQHRVVAATVPWARHGAGFTRAFEDTAAWLATHTSRVGGGATPGAAWRSVGRICARVAAEQATKVDMLEGLRRIGIDEISHKKGQRYLTVVVDHDRGRLVWAAPGPCEATLERFFDTLGEARCAEVELVSADAAEWIAAVVARRCPAVVRCADPFHVVKWATDALDVVRREVWNTARKGTAVARELKAPGSRCGRTPRT